MSRPLYFTLACAAVLALPLSAPSVARAEAPVEGFYLSGLVGPNFTRDTSENSITGARTNIDFGSGYGLGGAVGYGWANGLRAEFETTYRSNDVEGLTGAGAGAVQGGDISSLAFMANALMDIATDTPVTPYAGFGLGVARVNADNVGTFSGATLDSTENKFAYQAIAGLGVHVTHNLRATVDYRYFATLRPSFETSLAGVNSDLGYRNHSVMMGLRYIFADAPPPPPPPPPAPVAAPAPPPPPVMPPMAQPAAVVPQAPRSFIVFFDWDQDALTAQAQDIVRSVAEYVRAGGMARVNIVGHADRSGSTRYNAGLSERRAERVAGALEALGVPAGEIAARGMGETDPMVPTADGVREAQNRRATIEIQK